MRSFAIGLVFLAMAATPAPAHYIWIVPEKNGTGVQVFLSEVPEPENPEFLGPIANTQLFLRQADGKDLSLAWSKGKVTYSAAVPGQGPRTIGGVCRYGVYSKTADESFLLMYYAKAHLLGAGEAVGKKPLPATAWERLPLEIVQAEGQDLRLFRVLWQGKPVVDAEVAFVPPGQDNIEKRKTDKDGIFEIGSFKAGIYGLRARHIEPKEGEHDGKKYKEIRHFATLVVELPAALGAKTQAGAASTGLAQLAKATTAKLPPLPRAISSFGADVADGWVYVYGGHSAKTHEYSTTAVLGTFHRLQLSDPKAWEELPAGPALQGLALVAHKGKLFRVGGMQPVNKQGEKADNRSQSTCARFNPAAKKWESLPDMPEGRSSHDAVVVGDKLLVFGGWKLNGAGKSPDWQATSLILDLSKLPLQWEAVKQPFQRRALAAAGFEGKAYVIGGMDENDEIQLKVDIYDPKTNSWSTGPALPGPRSNGFGPAACAADGRLYVSVGDGKVLRLSAKSNGWEEVVQLEQRRIVHRLVALPGNSLLALGGAFGGDNFDFVERIVLGQMRK